MTLRIPERRLTPSKAYRVSAGIAAFDEVHTSPVDSATYASIVAAGGAVAHVAAESVYRCSVGTSSGDRALLRSHARPRASASRGRTTSIVGYATGTSVGCVRRWGAFSDTDGAYFQLDGDTLSAVVRSSMSGSTVNAATSKAAWSVESQRSVAIDVTRSHLWEIRDSWPGDTIQFFVDGEMLHETQRPALGGAYRSPRLPVSIECVNAAATLTSGSFSCAAASVVVEDEPRHDRTAGRYASAAGVTTDGPVLALRPVATVGSLLNDAEIAPCVLTLSATADARVKLVQGATITGTFTADAGAFGEACAPSAYSGGVVIGEFAVPSSIALTGDDGLLPVLRVLATGAQDSLLVVATSASGSPITVRAALTWKETR